MPTRNYSTLTQPNGLSDDPTRNHDLVNHYWEVNPQVMLGAIITGSVLATVVVSLFLRQIPTILRITPGKYVGRTMALCGVYCIIAAAALTSLIVSQAVVFCDSICHFAFTVCAYQFYSLCVEYIGGETAFIKRCGGIASFNLQTPPCCCCLKCLEPAPMNKKKFVVTRVMVLQMAIIQGAMLGVLNVLYLIDSQLYNGLLPFFVPFLVASILTGVWGLQITARMIAPYLPEYNILKKYFAIQLVLIFCKLQPAILNPLFDLYNSFNDHIIIGKTTANALIQIAILVEMILLSLLAHTVYRTPSKDSETF